MDHFIQGFLVSGFLYAVGVNDLKSYNWWAAMLSLNGCFFLWH